MCLCVPGRVVQVVGLTATVDFWGLKKEIFLATVDEAVEPGDYVLTHVGFAIRRIPPSEIAETLAFYDALVYGKQDDLMAADISSELDIPEGN